MITDEPMEVYDSPVFSLGEKVRATKYVKNDGTYPLKDIGEVLVAKGDVGYVRDIGMFLQRFYVYAVDFVDRGTIVGMRGKELVSLDKAAADPAVSAPIAPTP
jgi:nitrogen fixation protein NifZ